jgi:predicted AlkP superfamily phosphohydrolase/phosphomutase
MEVPERGKPDTTTIGENARRKPKKGRCVRVPEPVRDSPKHSTTRFIPRRFLPAVRVATAVLVLVLGNVHAAEAYVGPGAGFVLLTSFFVLFTTIAVVVLSLLAWPFRALWRALMIRKTAPARIRRLVVVGFDGQDPRLTDRFLAEGILPNFAKLRDMGAYRRLRTTYPPVSPVAWSSFTTGCQPGRHNVFDFLEPDRRTYLPRLSSVRVTPARRFWRLGRYRIPRERADVRRTRMSKPFWTILGEHRIWSTVLRVPITFPPDKFYGAQLSAMCVPDLLGTQGTFVLFTSRPAATESAEQGLRVQVPPGADALTVAIPGPENTFVEGHPQLSAPMRLAIDRVNRRVRASIGDAVVELRPGELSEWVTIRFHAAPGINFSGLSRLLVSEMDEHFSLYLSPICLDPERPAMPISHPSFYATYLAKLIGPYSTLGLAEDTWALNEGVITEGTFLQQVRDINQERERMLFGALDRLSRGSLVCVFDATDRVQHMCWRHLDDAHPAANSGADGARPDAIRDLYRDNDRIVGRLIEQLGADDVLMVISDHGFESFRRCVNVNSWLHREGYLQLKPGTDGRAEWLRDVDWTTTRAYAIGLTGIFLNVRGREQQGCVAPGPDAAALKAAIRSRLSGLADGDDGGIAIREVFDTATLYTGPYTDNAPDLLVGYNAGYRASWSGAKGVVHGPVIEDNGRPWSGDHCIDPRLVPGVFFCNRTIDTQDPALVDIAPTALRLFGIEPPAYMDGRPLEGLA